MQAKTLRGLSGSPVLILDPVGHVNLERAPRTSKNHEICHVRSLLDSSGGMDMSVFRRFDFGKVSAGVDQSKSEDTQQYGPNSFMTSHQDG